MAAKRSLGGIVIYAGALLAAILAMSSTIGGATRSMGIQPILSREFDSAVQQINALGNAVLQIEYDNLIWKLKYNGRLDERDQERLCQLAKILEILTAPGC